MSNLESLPGPFDSLLRDHARACKLTSLLAKLQVLARPCINIDLAVPGTEGRLSPMRLAVKRLGASKFGGTPDLPVDVAWPERYGKLMSFIAQINLAEVPPVIDILPKQGWLYFFLGLDDPTVNIDHTIIYWDDPGSRLVKYDMPPRGRFIREFMPTYPAAGVRFSPGVTLPRLYVDRSFDGYSDQLEELRLRLDGTPQGERDIRRLLGHPNHLHGGRAEQEAYVVAQGHPELMHHLHAAALERLDELLEKYRATNYAQGIDRLLKIKAALPWFHGDLERHRREIAHWRLLFEVQSYLSCDMSWQDMGVLQVMIHERDLKAGVFSNTYATIACG